jgi:hypothetical protein
MAQVWFSYAGPPPTTGVLAYERPIEDLVDKLGGWSSFRWIIGLRGNIERPEVSSLGQIAGYQYAILKLEEGEAAPFNWAPGFYLATLTPKSIIGILGPPDVVPLH